MKSRQKVVEGVIFSVSESLLAEGVIGVLARYFGKFPHLKCGCYFFYNSEPFGKRTYELLKSLTPIKVCQTSDLGFKTGEWSIIENIDCWETERTKWKLPAFKSVDAANPLLATVRTYDDITNSIYSEANVTAIEALGYHQDGVEGHKYTESQLNYIIEYKKEEQFRKMGQNPIH